MKETHILDVFTTLAANSADPAYNPFNAVLLEIYYLLLRGVKPQQLILDPEKVRTNIVSSVGFACLVTDQIHSAAIGRAAKNLARCRS